MVVGGRISYDINPINFSRRSLWSLSSVSGFSHFSSLWGKIRSGPRNSSPPKLSYIRYGRPNFPLVVGLLLSVYRFLSSILSCPKLNFRLSHATLGNCSCSSSNSVVCKPSSRFPRPYNTSNRH